MQKFTQETYNVLVDSLDKCMEVFLDDGRPEGRARESLKAFLEEHYFPVWREMTPDTSTKAVKAGEAT